MSRSERRLILMLGVLAGIGLKVTLVENLKSRVRDAESALDEMDEEDAEE